MTRAVAKSELGVGCDGRSKTFVGGGFLSNSLAHPALLAENPGGIGLLVDGMLTIEDGQKKAVVPTSQGMRSLYCLEATVALFEDDLIAVMAKDHPLAGRTSLMPADFVPYEFFTYTLEHIAGWEHDRFFTPFGLVPVRRLEVELRIAVADRRVRVVAIGAVGPVLQRGHLAHDGPVGRGELLLAGVRPQPVQLPAHVDHRLVQRVAHHGIVGHRDIAQHPVAHDTHGEVLQRWRLGRGRRRACSD